MPKYTLYVKRIFVIRRLSFPVAHLSAEALPACAKPKLRFGEGRA